MTDVNKPVGFIYTYYAGSDYDNQNIRHEVISNKDFENLDESEKDDAELQPLYVIPPGYTLVPDSTTSLQKFRVNGEFFISRDVDCHDCDEDDVDPECEECEECGGNGSYEHKSVIPWTTCKDIYYAMLKAAKEQI